MRRLIAILVIIILVAAFFFPKPWLHSHGIPTTGLSVLLGIAILAALWLLFSKPKSRK